MLRKDPAGSNIYTWAPIFGLGSLPEWLVGWDSDRILGFTSFGPEAGELMSTVQVAMLAGLPYTILRDAMFAHPTMTEGLKALFMSVPQVMEKRAGHS